MIGELSPLIGSEHERPHLPAKCFSEQVLCSTAAEATAGRPCGPGSLPAVQNSGVLSSSSQPSVANVGFEDRLRSSGSSVPAAARPVLARSRKKVDAGSIGSAVCPAVSLRTSTGDSIVSQATAISRGEPALVLAPGALHQPHDLAVLPYVLAGRGRGVGEHERRVGVLVAIAHRRHLLPQGAMHLDDPVPLGRRNLRLDLRRPGPLARAGFRIDGEEVFRLNGARVAIREDREPAPRARPVVALCLLFALRIALGDALGLAQLHRAPIAVAVAADRIYRLGASLFALATAHAIPFVVECERARFVGRRSARARTLSV